MYAPCKYLHTGGAMQTRIPATRKTGYRYQRDKTTASRGHNYDTAPHGNTDEPRRPPLYRTLEILRGIILEIEERDASRSNTIRYLSRWENRLAPLLEFYFIPSLI